MQASQLGTIWGRAKGVRMVLFPGNKADPVLGVPLFVIGTGCMGAELVSLKRAWIPVRQAGFPILPGPLQNRKN